MTKYKYYFRKPRSEIIKDIFKILTLSGLIYIASTSPYFVHNLMKDFKRLRKYKRKNVYDMFYRLQKEGCIEVGKKNHQTYISLTEKGRKKAGWLQIDSLKINRPKKWDKKWRIVIFDISQIKKLYREIFRGKIKELGFYKLQKSVWIIPFDCRDEIELLKNFFGLSAQEIKLIIAVDIGEDSYSLQKIFRL